MAEKQETSMEKMAGFLDRMNKKYKKKYGENVLYKGDELSDFKPFSTGFPEFDWVNSGIGGFPRGGMTLIHGLESTGKSTFVLESIRNCMEKDSTVVGLYIDVESAMTKSFLKYKDMFPDRLTFTSLNTEDALNTAEEAIKDDIFDIIVIDSLAKLDSEKILEKEIGEAQQRNRRAVIITEFLRRITFILRRSRAALICINQEVQNQDAGPFAPKTILPCGMQQKFSANLRIELKRTKQLTAGDKKVGYLMIMTSAKNKIANKEKAMTQMMYMYDRGFIREFSLLNFLVRIGHVKELTGKRYEFVPAKKELYHEVFKLGDIGKIVKIVRDNYGIDLYDVVPDGDFQYDKNEEYKDVGVDEKIPNVEKESLDGVE